MNGLEEHGGDTPRSICISKGAWADPPNDPGELIFLLPSTRTPAVAEFIGPDGGKTAHYMLRWPSTCGEAGPWSETASATIGA